ncbi:34490_t:CDS:2 [Racocetra persica]|uniref:34490_t:CDS:1 n=1 Tax=Racocetra persica TaxID=160502 RepID=A0ACA9LFS1_9GLOM|nr:34490_t:CDS:2 [Racocetra persica]
MSFVSWNKLTLAELKELCLTCGLTSGGNKEELGERLHAYFEKRKGKQPDSEFVAGEMSHDPYIDTEGADDNIRDTLAARFQGQEQGCHPEVMPADMFLSALRNLENKMDKNFSALHKEIEESDLLSEAWPAVKLAKARDQHEYDFLSKMGRRLDKAIKLLPSNLKKDFICIRDDMESRAVMLRLANKKGDIIIGVIRIGTIGTNIKGKEIVIMTRLCLQILTTRVPFAKVRREVKGRAPFMEEDFRSSDRTKGITCFNCGGFGYVATNCPSANAKSLSRTQKED